MKYLSLILLMSLCSCNLFPKRSRVASRTVASPNVSMSESVGSPALVTETTVEGVLAQGWSQSSIEVFRK